MQDVVGVLDKGWMRVDLITPSAITAGTIVSYDRWTALPFASITIKCPLFIQLFLSTSTNFNIASTKGDERDYFLPNEADITTVKLQDAVEMRKHMQATAEALFVSCEGYKKDGCDSFIAQTMLPVSTYTYITLSGNFEEWMRFLDLKIRQDTIARYQSAIGAALKAEWFVLMRTHDEAKKEKERL